MTSTRILHLPLCNLLVLTHQTKNSPSGSRQATPVSLKRSKVIKIEILIPRLTCPILSFLRKTDSERRPFSDEVAASGDVESLVTPGAKEAYSALIDGVASKTESSESLQQHQQQRTPRSAGHLSVTEEEGGNVFVYPQQHASRSVAVLLLLSTSV